MYKIVKSGFLAFLILFVAACGGGPSKERLQLEEFGDLSVFEKGIQSLENIDELDQAGYTLLFEAVYHDKPKHAKLLLENGADMYYHVQYLGSPVDQAVKKDGIEIFMEFYKRDADSIRRRIESYQMIHKMVELNSAKVLAFLISEYLDPNFTYADRNLLHYAAEGGSASIEAFDTLLALGADPNKPDLHGRTPLYYVKDFKDSRMSKTLIGKGARFDVKDEEGLSPLAFFIRKGFLTRAKVFLSLGVPLEHGLEVFISKTEVVYFEGKTKIYNPGARLLSQRSYEKKEMQSDVVTNEYTVPLIDYAAKNDTAFYRYLVETGYNQYTGLGLESE